ncbi:transposase [Desulfosporosinus youngiae DSM 17734]|uniref:Transposase n=2 Tax=Desulfosporosinus TaxID=79206 RepID=H5XTJ5_9FIRM|nr:transposase [Desulfosporosinus youngiae DSM 17734]
MLTMDKIHTIRFRFHVKGEKISQIAQDMNLDWKTVRKYVDMTDFNAPAPKPASEKLVCPKLDPYKATINRWLEEDKQAPRKQRHTAKRVFNRLKQEFPDFNCSYRTVAAYYAVKHQGLFSQAKKGYLPLDHRPGEAQVDFGTADFYENGTRRTGKYLEVSFPHSNKGYLQLFYGENMECLLEGMDTIFRHIGVVPAEVWFDNTKTIVTKILRGGRALTERFERFQEHYGFQSVFTNPGEGQEKGNVENKVGYHRRNLLVPIPRFLALAGFNRQLLKQCDDDAAREHYRHNETIEELFKEDLLHCHPLPNIDFDLSGKQSIVTNNWGKFYRHKGMHEYSASPKHANEVVNLKLTSSHIIVMDENYREIVRHRRLYGNTKQQSMEWLPYLKQLSIRPRALKYSGVYDMMPPSLKQFLEKCSHSETGKVLKVLAELTDRTGFDSALNTINQALTYGASDADSLQNLYRRLYADVPELPPMPTGPQMPNIGQMSANLMAYDVFLGKGGVMNAR